MIRRNQRLSLCRFGCRHRRWHMQHMIRRNQRPSLCRFGYRHRRSHMQCMIRRNPRLSLCHFGCRHRRWHMQDNLLRHNQRLFRHRSALHPHRSVPAHPQMSHKSPCFLIHRSLLLKPGYYRSRHLPYRSLFHMNSTGRRHNYHSW